MQQDQTRAKHKDDDPPSFLTDEQLAARWGMSAKTLRNARVSGGYVPFVRLGRLVRYRLSDVLAWEAAHTRSSTSQGEGER